jgi:hypothetical protein
MGSAENGQRRLQSGRGGTIAGPGERQRLIFASACMRDAVRSDYLNMSDALLMKCISWLMFMRSPRRT